MEKNLSNLNMKFVTTTYKTVSDLYIDLFFMTYKLFAGYLMPQNF